MRIADRRALLKVGSAKPINPFTKKGKRLIEHIIKITGRNQDKAGEKEKTSPRPLI